MSYRYILRPYKGVSSRGTCPGCGQKHCYSPYIDTEAGDVELGPGVGRCNREEKCGYHYSPAQFFTDNPDQRPEQEGQQDQKRELPRREPPRPASLIPDEIFNRSLTAPGENNFIKYLLSQYPEATVRAALSGYLVGTSKHWPGATVFWQISKGGEIRAGKIMLYNPETGKRVKEPFNHITWAHKALNLEDYNLRQCLFGEQLLAIRPGAPVAIVESEKTAIIASIYLPEFVWLACGSLNNLSVERCRVLVGRDVTLFPDLNGYGKWLEKSATLAPICNVTVSDILEQIATPQERESGLDLADYITRTEYRAYSLREAFKQEFLGPEELHPDRQRDIWLEYRAKGLPDRDVWEVVQELLTQHNFKIA